MKKKLAFVFSILFMIGIAFFVMAEPPPSPPAKKAVNVDSNCNQAKYYALGTLCQDTDDGKLYKGITSGVTEVTSGEAAGDMTKADYDGDANGKVDAAAIDDLSATYAVSAHNHAGVYQPADADLGTWSTISPASSVTNFLSGATAAYAYGMPNMQAGVSSYVLTSIGPNRIPIWTNAPAGAGGAGDMTKAVYDTDSDNKVDVAALDFEAATISGVTLNWTSGVTLPRLATVTSDVQAQIDGKSSTSHAHAGVYQPADSDLGTWSTISPASSVTAFLSGATSAYAYGMPNMQSGASSYVLTSIGPNKIPIWTNAPAGGGSGDMTKAVYDTDADNKVDVLALDLEAATISGVTLNWASGVTLPYLSGVTSTLQSQINTISGTSLGWTSGVTMPRLIGAPDMDSGTTGYLLKAQGNGAVPVWSNTISGVSLTGGTASTIAQWNANGEIDNLSGTTNTRLLGVPDFQSGTSDYLLIASGSGVLPKWSKVKSANIDWASGTTLPRLNGAPDFQTGTSSYVLTSIGPNKVPIWTNAPAGGGSGDMTKAVYDTDSDNKVDVLQLDLEAGTISGVTLSWSSGVTLPYLSGVTSTLQAQINTISGTSLGWTSGVTMPRLSGVTNHVQAQLNTISGTSTIANTGTAPTVGTTEGRWGIDSTARQIVAYSGATEVVLAGVTEFMAFTISGVTDVGTADDHFLASLPYNITIKEIAAIVRRNGGAAGNGTTTTIELMECTGSAPGTCTDIIGTDWVLSGATTATLYKSAFAKSTMSRNNILKLDVVSGSTDSDLNVTVKYWINRE